MQTTLSGTTLNDASTQIGIGTSAKVLGVIISSALSGTVTFSSVGGTANWAPSATGFTAAPGTGLTYGPTFAVLSNVAADAGKVSIVYQPL